MTERQNRDSRVDAAQRGLEKAGITRFSICGVQVFPAPTVEDTHGAIILKLSDPEEEDGHDTPDPATPEETVKVGDKVRIGGGSDYEGRIGTLVAIEEGDVLWPRETYRVELDSEFEANEYPVHCGVVEAIAGQREELKPPVELSAGYTDHDAHGYRHGLGPCVCSACKRIRKLASGRDLGEEGEG